MLFSGLLGLDKASFKIDGLNFRTNGAITVLVLISGLNFALL